MTVTANAARATSAELAATSRLPGVTAAAGPFAQATVLADFQGQPWGQLRLAGRSAPGGPVDDLVLNAGHWVDGPGQVVLNGYDGNGGVVVGNTLQITSAPGKPTLTVVGIANSITSTADGWVAPGEIAALRTPGTPPTAQLLYRFAAAGSDAQIRADVAAITRALPAGAIVASASWLTAQFDAQGNGAIMEPFVIAFALIGLVMAVLIVGNVISGAVVAQYQRIGVLKSLGLTPAQVVAVYLRRVGWPALAGCLIGVVAGGLLAVPVLHQSAGAYGVGSQQVPWWALVVAPAGMLALTMLAALGPAVRAGRLSAIDAIAAGRAPRSGRGYAAHRLAARLRLPRPVGLGVAAPFARPSRTLVTLAAVAFGATAVIFAVGLNSSLSRAAETQSQSATVPVQIQQDFNGVGPNQLPTAAQFAAVTAALRSQPGTAHAVTLYGNAGHGRGDLPAGPGACLRRARRLDRVRSHRRPLVRRARRGRRQHLVPRRERPGPRRHHDRGHRDRPGHRPHRRRSVRAVTRSRACTAPPRPCPGWPPSRTSGRSTWDCARAPAPPPTFRR